MCDYSLQHVSWRSAKVNDKLVATEFASSSTRGFAAVGERGAKLVIDETQPKVAVCLLPGTELVFDECVRYHRAFGFVGQGRINHKVARFRQVDIDDPDVEHDALEFPDGRVLKVARLASGQTARVLELPVAVDHAEPASCAIRPPEAPLAVDRVGVGSGMASILAPSQGTITLLHTWRGVAARLTLSVGRSLHRAKKVCVRRAMVKSAWPADAIRLDADLTRGGEPEVAPKAPTLRSPGEKTDGRRYLETVSDVR